MTTKIIITFATIRENADTTIIGELYGNVDVLADRTYVVDGDFAAGCERALKLISAYKNSRGAVRVTVTETGKPTPNFSAWAMRPTDQAIAEIRDWAAEMERIRAAHTAPQVVEWVGCECEIDWDCGCGSQTRYASARDF